jgi:hypothetical protein
LRSAAVVIADLSGDLASACYELGIALVLGKPVVVLASADAVPFDIDVDPVQSPDPVALGDAIDRALVLRQRVASTGSLGDLAAAVRKRFPDQRNYFDSIDAHIAEPLAVASTLYSLLQQKRRETSSTALVSYPTWRRHYPDEAPHLFHIMPFRSPWSDAAKQSVRRAAGVAGAMYRRHDDVRDPQILRSLWEELTRATHFVVDLTDINPNVAVELGIVDALGMATLLVGQPGTVGRLFPMIRRVRVTEYADSAELEGACADWLGASLGSAPARM